MTRASRAVCVTLVMASGLLAGPVFGQAAGGLAPAAGAPAQGKDAIKAQLSAWFDKWDKDHDNFLDKEELAHAFRGAKAKPYDDSKDFNSDGKRSSSAPLLSDLYRHYPD